MGPPLAWALLPGGAAEEMLRRELTAGRHTRSRTVRSKPPPSRTRQARQIPSSPLSSKIRRVQARPSVRQADKTSRVQEAHGSLPPVPIRPARQTPSRRAPGRTSPLRRGHSSPHSNNSRPPRAAPPSPAAQIPLRSQYPRQAGTEAAPSATAGTPLCRMVCAAPPATFATLMAPRPAGQEPEQTSALAALARIRQRADPTVEELAAAPLAAFPEAVLAPLIAEASEEVPAAASGPDAPGPSLKPLLMSTAPVPSLSAQPVLAVQMGKVPSLATASERTVPLPGRPDGAAPPQQDRQSIKCPGVQLGRGAETARERLPLPVPARQERVHRRRPPASSRRALVPPTADRLPAPQRSQAGSAPSGQRFLLAQRPRLPPNRGGGSKRTARRAVPPTAGLPSPNL